MKEPVKCPYCNSSVKICVTETGAVRKAWVECPFCETRGPIEAWPFGMTDEEAAVDAWNELFKRTESLRAENAKLRELVVDMRLFILLASAIEGVSIHAHGKPTLSMEAFERRMRELGIEVDA